jgi:hypothetical protein
MSQWWIDERKLLGTSNPTNRELENLYQEGFGTIISPKGPTMKQMRQISSSLIVDFQSVKLFPLL